MKAALSLLALVASTLANVVPKWANVVPKWDTDKTMTTYTTVTTCPVTTTKTEKGT